MADPKPEDIEALKNRILNLEETLAALKKSTPQTDDERKRLQERIAELEKKLSDADAALAAAKEKKEAWDKSERRKAGRRENDRRSVPTTRKSAGFPAGGYFD